MSQIMKNEKYRDNVYGEEKKQISSIPLSNDEFIGNLTGSDVFFNAIYSP